MKESFKQTMESIYHKEKGDHIPFFLSMNTLEQIALLKVLESRVLYIFRDDIEREGANGSISLLSAIQNTANAIYFISQVPDAFSGRKTLRNELEAFERRLNSYKVIGEREKEKIISDFSNLAMTVYENTINNMYKEDNKLAEDYCKAINDNIGNLIKNNFDIINQIKGAMKNEPTPNNFEDNENMEYVAKTDFKDPSIM